MEIEKIREQIDCTDREIAKLFEKRMELVKLVAEYKKANRKRITDKKREDAVIEKIRAEIADERIKDYGEEIFRAIIELSKDYQSELND